MKFGEQRNYKCRWNQIYMNTYLYIAIYVAKLYYKHNYFASNLAFFEQHSALNSARLLKSARKYATVFTACSLWALLLGNWLRTVLGNSSVLCQHTVSCSNIFAITLCTISTLGLSLAWDYLSSFSCFKMPTLPVATCHLATTCCCCCCRSHSPRHAAKLTKLPLGNLLKSPFAVCTGLTKHISVSFTGQNEEKKKNKAREISEKRSPKYRTTTRTTRRRRRGKRETSWWRPETQLHKQATRVKIACNLFGSNFIEAQKFARPQKFRHRHRRSPAPELSLALSLAFRL